MSGCPIVQNNYKIGQLDILDAVPTFYKIQYDAEGMEAYEVSSYVNSPAHDEQKVIEPAIRTTLF